MPEEQRNQIKTGFLELLGQPEIKKVKNAGMCIAAIAAIEISRNQWQGFLEMITNNATAQPYNYNVRYASMLTIEYLSDFMQQIDVEMNQ